MKEHLTLSILLVAGAACVAGCAGSPPATASTTPVTVHDEPRSATGQLLEDLFFARVASASRFDMDAALDEDGSYGEDEYYDEIAAGEYDDELASGEEDEATLEAEVRRDELRDAQAQLTQLEAGLAAEGHPLAGAVGELRERIIDALAESEESGDTLVLEEGVAAILSDLLSGAQEQVTESAPRPGNPTDCSAATIVLYAAAYDAFVEVSAHAHVNLYSFTSEREEWESVQAEQVAGVTALIEWIEGAPSLSDVGTVQDRAMELSDALLETDEFLTAGSQQAVSEALSTLNQAETEGEARAGLEALRTAALATLESVRQPPYEAEIAAFAALPEQLIAIMNQLPSPGPRAALRLYRQGDITRLAETIDYPLESLAAVAQWTGVACGGEAAVSRP